MNTLDIKLEPVISIIIPVYNSQKHIRKCLISIIGQTVLNFEIIIVNDGSVDDSVKIIEDIFSAHAHIAYQIVHHQQNKGVSAARNTGLASSEKEYVIFVDNDDYVEPDMVETLLASAFKNQADMVLGRVRVVDESNNEILIMPHSDFSKPVDPVTALSEMFFHQFAFFSYRTLYKRTLFEGINFPEQLSMCEDAVTIPYVFLKAAKIVFVQNVIYNYVDRPNSLSKRFQPDSYALIPYLKEMKNKLASEVGNKQLADSFIISNTALTHDLCIIATKYGADYQQARPILNTWKEYITFNEIIALLAHRRLWKRFIKLILLKVHTLLFYKSVKSLFNI